MKLALVFAAVILAASASNNEELWTKFKQDHGKTYKSLRDEKLRFGIFKSTLNTIKDHNAKYENGEETWFMSVNQFSDLTDEEFKAQYLSTIPMNFESIEVMSFNLTAPDSIDWRSKGAVLPVQNQGSCGSCWAFSAVAAIEGQNAIKHNVKVRLSEQELVDCANGRYENEGCNGGMMEWAFNYVRDHGISKTTDYPYRGTDGSCRSQKNTAHIKLTGYRSVTRNNENQLKQAVGSVGPISVAIDADRIKNYGGGIFNNFHCGETLNHGVLAVGYGSHNHHDFWIVKNSWGTQWGEHGYIKMTRNRFNQCGISSQASYPVLA